MMLEAPLSLQDTHALVMQFSGHIALGTPRRIEPFTSYRNRSYKLQTSQGIFLLRQHQPLKTEADLAWEHAVSEHARRQAIRTPAVLGSTRWQDRFYSVYEWVAGPVLPRRIASPSSAYSAGMLLAQLHQAISTFRPSDIDVRCQPIEDRQAEALKAAGQRIVDIPAYAQQTGVAPERCIQIEELISLAAHLSSSADQPPPPTDETQALHGDFNPRNILMTTPEWTVVDWEDSFLGGREFDLALALLYLCGFPEDHPGQLQSRYFLLGYHNLSRLGWSDVRRVLWKARFAIAANLNWLLIAHLEQDWRRLDYLERDILRLKRLNAFQQEHAFDSSLPKLLSRELTAESNQ